MLEAWRRRRWTAWPAVSGLLLAASAGCTYDWTTVAKDAGAADAARDCRVKADCRGDEYCAFPDSRCGRGAVGACLKRPQIDTCTDEKLGGACTCEDVGTLDSVCRIAAAGSDVCDTPLLTYSLCGKEGAKCRDKVEACTGSSSKGSVAYKCLPLKCPLDDCLCLLKTYCAESSARGFCGDGGADVICTP